MTAICDQSLPARLRGRWFQCTWMVKSPRPLAWFRIGLSVVLLAQAFSLLGQLGALYGRHGVVDWSVDWDNQSPWLPSVSWLERPLALAGLPPALAVPLVFAAYVVGLFGLLVGDRTRLLAVLAWLTHAALLGTSTMSSYGVDQFARIGLFYCVFMPVGHALSLDRASGRVGDAPSFESWLSLRVLQLHVCIFYTAAGVEKMLGEQWWNGEAIWRAIMGAPLASPIDCSFLAAVPWLSKAICWMTLLLEAGVIAFVWHPRLRKLWLVGIIGMHLCIALVIGLWTFSAVMIVFDIAAFGCSSRRMHPVAFSVVE